MMTTADFDRENFESWLKTLQRARENRERLVKLAQLIEEGRSDKETVIRELFPNKPREKALSDFRVFKKRVNEQAKRNKIPLFITEKEGKVLIQKAELDVQEHAIATAIKSALKPDLREVLVPVLVRPSNLSKIAIDNTAGATSDALYLLKTWALEKDREPLLIILGEFGTGKTTLTRWLTQELLEERTKNSSLPLPIYFDLRHLSKETRKKPKLKTILQELIENWYQSGGVRDLVTPDQIASLVRSGRAFVIFDGLDEVLVYLTPEEGRRFVRELRSITYDRDKQVGRAIMTIRTHYFRTLRDAVSYFTGEDREGISGTEYLALLLLPFNEEQIRTYFEQSFGDRAQAERAMALVESIYNLSELATRPYLLRLIWEHYEELEHLKAKGLRVSAARFYEIAVNRWIKRDDPKHQIRPDHKRLFMEHLAAELWKSGERSWNVDQVETWFSNFLMQNPGFRARYGDISPEFMERLIEDLRTATFIVHDGVDRFRFAHTSLQEFFLASYLLKAILEERYERWNLPTPSPETLDFLAQLWHAHEEREKLFKNARAMGQRPLGQANENLVRFLLFARERYEELKGFSFAGFHLEGANLVGLELGNPDPEGPKANWARAVFDGAKLRDARFTNANLEGASFKGADLTRAEFWKARAVGAGFEGARLVGAFYREAGLREARFNGGHFRRTKWVRSRLTGAGGLPGGAPEGFFARNEGMELETRPETFEGLVLPRRFSGGVTALAALERGRLAVGNEKGDLRLLDAESGERLWEEMMPGGVLALAALEGARLAAGDNKGNLWLLDAKSGERVWEEKMPGSVYALAALEGGRLAAGNSRGDLWLLDAESGERVWEGKMPGRIEALAALEGDRLVAGDDEGNLWLFNAESAERLWEQEMLGEVTALAALGGDRLAAGGSWGIWLLDAESGEQVWEGKMPGWLNALAALGDGRLAAGDDEGNLWLFDAESGKRVWEREMPDEVQALSALEGGLLAAGDSRGNLWLLDAESREQVWEREMPGSVEALAALGPSRLAVAGDWGSVLVFEVRTGEQTRLEQVAEFVRAPDGEYLSAFSNKIVAASPRAWRWAYVRGRDAEGRIEVYPYEAVDDLPTS